jgi:Cu+-exporting ATPase
MTTMASDPVCGVRIDEAECWGIVRFEGRTFHFCSELCKARFDADPERYALGSGSLDTRP